jgi:hypothetical protein
MIRTRSLLIAGFGLLLILAVSSCAGASSNSTATSAPPSGTSPSATTGTEEPTINVPVIDKAKLPVIQFSVSPPTISPGGAAVLTWSVTNATSVTIDHGVGAVSASGTRNVSPTAPTTYKLTAGNDTGSSVKTVSLAVVQAITPPPPVSNPKAK